MPNSHRRRKSRSHQRRNRQESIYLTTALDYKLIIFRQYCLSTGQLSFAKLLSVFVIPEDTLLRSSPQSRSHGGCETHCSASPWTRGQFAADGAADRRAAEAEGGRRQGHHGRS